MSPVEEALELAANEIPREAVAEPAEGKFIDDLVEEVAGVGTVGQETVEVLPAAKRAANLNIAKLAAGDVVAMLGDPEEAERADAKRNPSAVFDASGAGDDAETFARRSEALEGTGLGMPAIKSGSRGADAGAFGEAALGHGRKC